VICSGRPSRRYKNNFNARFFYFVEKLNLLKFDLNATQICKKYSTFVPHIFTTLSKTLPETNSQKILGVLGD
jgi:hypothetical protein